MTILQTEDTRNTEWRDSNVGSKMLAKMGWKEGDGIGKRNVSTMALRAVKRQQGLGIGAKRQTEGGPSESTGTFASVLANLQAHHGTGNGGGCSSKRSKKKKKKKEEEAKRAKKAARTTKKSLSLPRNKVLAGHARKMRDAKFGAKSAADLACIFGNTEVVETALGGASASASTSNAASKQRSRPTEAPSASASDYNDGNSNSNSSESSIDHPVEEKPVVEANRKKDKKSRNKKAAEKEKKAKKEKKKKKKKKSKSD